MNTYMKVNTGNFCQFYSGRAGGTVWPGVVTCILGSCNADGTVAGSVSSDKPNLHDKLPLSRTIVDMMTTSLYLV